MTEQEDPKALARQRVILDVLAERMNVTQAALELGISRKTFYEWQERALAGMREALRDRPGGRPAHPVDPLKDQLQEKVDTLEKERLILEGRLRIQEAGRQTRAEFRQGQSPPPKKKRTV